ncbi:MAG: hypothetical protein ACK5TQ_21385, partial [Acetobacteraceae bacterium]
MLTQAENGKPAEFGFGFTIDANRSLSFMLHGVYLALARTPTEGTAGVEASIEFRAAFNATALRMMTVVLKNQHVAGLSVILCVGSYGWNGRTHRYGHRQSVTGSASGGARAAGLIRQGRPD